MSDKNQRTPADLRSSDPSRPSRKRFRIQKLEERIAPKGGKGTRNCDGGGDSGQSSGFSASGGPSSIF